MGGVTLAIDALARGVAVMIRQPRVTAIFGCGFLTLLGVLTVLQAIVGENADQPWAVILILTSIAGTATFFEGATVHGALAALRGDRARVFASIGGAGERAAALFRFGLVAAVVSLALMHVAGDDPDRLPFRLAVWAWTLTSFFVVPLIIAEGRGALGALSSSLGLVSRGFVAIILVELARRFLSLGIFLALFALGEMEILPMPAFVVLILVCLSAIGAMSSVFSASLYLALTEKPDADIGGTEAAASASDE